MGLSLVHLLCSSGFVDRPPLPPPSLPSPPPLWHRTHLLSEVPGECEPFWQDGQHCVAGVSNCKLKVEVALVITPNSCADYTFRLCGASSVYSNSHKWQPQGTCIGFPAVSHRVYAKVCPSERYDECVLPPAGNYGEDSDPYEDDYDGYPLSMKEMEHCRAFDAGRV